MKLIRLLQLYADEICREKGKPVGEWHTDKNEAKEERAAIIEFDGGLPRKEAEVLAGLKSR
jgi:hypothetical protein